MKNLLFYTFHRHLDEIYYSSCFFNRTKVLKNIFDVHLHCNNPSHSIQSIKQNALFESKIDVTVTTKNSGYYAGVAEAHSDCFELFKNYDLVIISQIDCYIIDETKLISLLNKSFDVLASPMFHVNRLCYAGDFFVIRPKINFLCDWKKHLIETSNPVHEHFLYDSIKRQNLNTLEFNRYESTNLVPHHNPDDFGLWHEHKNHNIKNYLQIN